MITRRKLFQAATTVGVGVLASPAGFTSMDESNMVPRIFFDSYGALALRQAVIYAGDDGFVASLPQILRARVNADYDNIIWNTWFTANSDESIVKTPQGNNVVVIVHGGGITGNPARLEQSLRADMNRHNEHGLTGQYGARITESEARDLLSGRLPDGTEFPIYDFDTIRQGIADLPWRYGVVLDFAKAKESETGYVEFGVMRDHPLAISRAGGGDIAADYFDKAQKRNNTNKMRIEHLHEAINPDELQTCLITLGGNKGGIGSEGHEGLGWGYGEDWGFGWSGPVGMDRYIGVAPHDESATMQQLSFDG